MKGVVFNILESFICEGWGEEKYEEILSLCPLKTKEPFVGPGTYPDSDLITIAAKTAEILGLPLQDAIRAFGRYSFPKLAGKFPGFINKEAGPLAFLRSVHDVIHVEVRKLYPKAVTPEFRYRGDDPDRVIVEYHSKRQLCAFMEGLLEGLGEFYETDLSYDHVKCTHRGADFCEFDVRAVHGVSREVA